MLEHDLVRLERALGTDIDPGASRRAALASAATVSIALEALDAASKRRALAGLVLRGARELLLVPGLLRCLRDCDGEVRCAAAALLWSTAAETGLGPFEADAVDAFLGALDDEDARVRTSTTGALGAIQYADAETLGRVVRRVVRAAVDAGDHRAAAVTHAALRSLLEQLPSGAPGASA
ncbi:MAG TPA: HEAT repeat domain-containing protein [Anaeromyxobacter sp.]|nr:HEAT repeat domain-containing protein [Anaeromyxobacter sp.]